jgi:hypothetical protein
VKLVVRIGDELGAEERRSALRIDDDSESPVGSSHESRELYSTVLRARALRRQKQGCKGDQDCTA